MKGSREETEKLLQVAVEMGIERYINRLEKEEKRKKVGQIYKLMKRYRELEQKMQSGNESVEIHEILLYERIKKGMKVAEDRMKQKGWDIKYKAFELHFAGGLSYEQISEMLNTGKNTPQRWILGVVEEIKDIL